MSKEDQEYVLKLFKSKNNDLDVYQPALIFVLNEYDEKPDDRTLLRILNRYKWNKLDGNRKRLGYSRRKKIYEFTEINGDKLYEKEDYIYRERQKCKYGNYKTKDIESFE